MEQDSLYQTARDAETRSQEAFQAVVTQAPESYRAHQITVDTLLLQQNEAGALEQYRTVASLNPKLPGVHEAMANCLMEQAHFADAVAELHIEEQLQPQSSQVAMELGRAELAMGDERSASDRSSRRSIARSRRLRHIFCWQGLACARAMRQQRSSRCCTTLP